MTTVTESDKLYITINETDFNSVTETETVYVTLSQTDNDTITLVKESIQDSLNPIGPPGPQGPIGPQGNTGAGIAAGGSNNQILAKASNTDYDTKWIDNNPTIVYTIDGGGAVIANGVAGIGIQVPYNCIINSVTMLADQTGSLVIDIWKTSYANYPPVLANSITGSAKPTITSNIKYQSSTLTGWTLTINSGDVLKYNVDSVSTIQKAMIILGVTKT